MFPHGRNLSAEMRSGAACIGGREEWRRSPSQPWLLLRNERAWVTVWFHGGRTLPFHEIRFVSYFRSENKSNFVGAKANRFKYKMFTAMKKIRMNGLLRYNYIIITPEIQCPEISERRHRIGSRGICSHSTMDGSDYTNTRIVLLSLQFKSV